MTTDKVDRRDSLVPFPSTCWTIIQNTKAANSTERHELLNELLLRYWQPIYAYYRVKLNSREGAEEMTQAFLTHCLETERILNVQRGESRFRSWVKVVARNFMIDASRKNRADRRSPGKAIVSLEALRSADGAPFEPIDDAPRNDAFHEAWRRQLLHNAVSSVRVLCEKESRCTHFEIFAQYYCREENERPTWQEIADKFRIETWKHAARKADWVKEQLRRAIRAEIRNYVQHDNEIDGELYDLLG